MVEHSRSICNKLLKSTVCSKYTRAGNSHLLIHSFPHFAQIKWRTVSDSLRLLKTNERPWANHSGCSRQMSNHEQIAQVAHEKWATLSDSLRSLMINKRMSDLIKKIWPTNLKSYFFVCFIYIFLFKNKQFAHSLFFLVSDVRETLRSLTKNEQC